VSQTGSGAEFERERERMAKELIERKMSIILDVKRKVKG
jgi:hypothetical protein